jgi:hypothetical protein
MVSDRFPRRTIALIAAYAVALQALFLAFVPLTPAVPGGFLAALCAHEGVDSPGPAKHDLPCAAMCAALGHGVTGPLPLGVSTLAARFWVFQAAVPASQWTLPRFARNEPHAPRGPPLA